MCAAISENGVSAHIPHIGPYNTQRLLAFLNTLYRDLIPEHQRGLVRPVTLVVGGRSGGPMRSVVSVHIVLIRILNKNNKTTNRTVLTGEAKHRTENNHPHHTGGKRLPKYDSQSETTNDTCL